jgi:hypothetical protein
MSYPGSSRGKMYLVGFEAVMKNLNAEIRKIENGSMQGLIKAAAMIRRETEKGRTKTPVDLGNLRASWFVVTASSVPVGRGTARFNGPHASEIIAEHSATLGQAKSIVSSGPVGKKFLMMGYSVNYAGFVHEMINRGKPINWSRDGSGPQWFQRAIDRRKNDILKIIADNVKIKR